MGNSTSLMGMSLALWMWKASSLVPSDLRYISIQALIRAAWLRRSSSARSASRCCSRRSRTKPRTNAPTVPTAEKTLAAVPSQSLPKVRLLPPYTGMSDPQAHRGMHGQPVDLAGRDPRNLAGFVARGGLAGDRAGGVDDGELLADLAVAGVCDDVAGVGVDAHEAGDLDL